MSSEQEPTNNKHKAADVVTPSKRVNQMETHVAPTRLIKKKRSKNKEILMHYKIVPNIIKQLQNMYNKLFLLNEGVV